jgi:hypothetical protein
MTSTIVTEPAVLSAVTGETDLLCNGDGSGTANVTINGGIAPYYYNWDTGDTTPVITGLYAGTYEVSITDNNGCMLIVDVTVNEPDFLIANSTGTQVFNLLCNGDGSGAILLATTGGTPGYSYYWNGPNSYSAYDQDIFSLYSGTYYVTATDVNGCTDSSSVIVTQPNILIAIASGTNLTCNSNNTGTVSVSVTGGTTPYNYSWSNGATVYNNTGLSAGTYTITVTDANGCSTSSSVTITQPPLTVITISGNLAVCSGDTTTLTASGATSYSWSPATGLNTTTGATVKSHPPTLNPITYTITGTNNCGSFSTSVTVTPGSPSFTYTATNALCNGGTGSITINATGGVSPYTYKVTNTTSNVVITQIGNNVFTGLASNAQYRMQVIDATGCASSISTIIITQPNILAVVVAKTNVTCNGSSNGILTCTANGGTGIKTYSDNGGSSFQPSNVFLGLAAGTYNVVVKDANGCISSVSIQTITQPALLTFTTTVSISCSTNSGTIIVYATGGSGVYNYSDNGGTTWGTGYTFSNLTAGTYSIKIKDANSCMSSISPVIIDITCIVPTNLATTNIAATSAMANWVQPSCYYGYTTRISKHNLNVWTNYTIAPNTHYTFSALAHNTTYDWQIQTNCNANGSINSGFSASQTFTTLARLEAGESDNFNSSFDVFPNPTDGILNICFSSDNNNAFNLSLIDVTGRIVINENHNAAIGNNQYQLNLASIAKGVYILMMQKGDAIIQKKIVVQ